jgi:hypothetical protein
VPGAGGRDDEDEALEDEEWKEAEDRDPFRDHKIAKKNLEKAYREASRHNAKGNVRRSPSPTNRG